MDELLTVEEVAAYLRVDRSTVYRLLRRGEISCLRVGSNYRVACGTLAQWLKDQEARTARETHANG